MGFLKNVLLLHFIIFATFGGFLGCGVKGAPTPYVESHSDGALQVIPIPATSPSPVAVPSPVPVKGKKKK